MSTGFWYIYEHTGFWYIYDCTLDFSIFMSMLMKTRRYEHTVFWYIDEYAGTICYHCSCAYNGQFTVTILKSRFSHRLDCLDSLTTPKMTGIDPCIRKANDVRRLNWVSLS
jgi:hypothetical protein